MTVPGLPDRVGTAVIGGGLTGLCLARHVAGEGADVTVFDDGRHAGSSANAGSLHVQMQSRFMRLYPDMIAAVERALPLYLAAVEEWRRLAESLAEPVELAVTGGLMVAESEEQVTFLERKCRREQRLGLPVEMLDRAGLDRIANYLGPEIIGAELCHIEGKMNPLAANRVVRQAAIDSGVRLLGCMVDHIEAEGNRYLIAVGDRTICADNVVIAAGAGAKGLAATLGLHIPVRAEPLHINITHAAKPFLGHLVQHADRMITLKQLASGHIVIGGGWPAGPVDSDNPPMVLPESMAGNSRLAAHIVPAIAKMDILRSWAGVNPTADGLSILGPHLRQPGVYFCIPGDAGYTLAPLVARLVAGLLAGRTVEFDLEPYRPDRFAL